MQPGLILHDLNCLHMLYLGHIHIGWQMARFDRLLGVNRCVVDFQDKSNGFWSRDLKGAIFLLVLVLESLPHWCTKPELSTSSPMELDAVAAQECQSAGQEPWCWLSCRCQCTGPLALPFLPEPQRQSTLASLVTAPSFKPFKKRVPSFGPNMVWKLVCGSDTPLGTRSSGGHPLCPDGLKSSLCFFSILPQVIPAWETFSAIARLQAAMAMSVLRKWGE